MFHCFSVPLCSTKRFYLSCFSDSQRGNEGVLLQSELQRPTVSSLVKQAKILSFEFTTISLLAKIQLDQIFLPRTAGRRDYKCFPIEPQIHRIVSEMYILKKILIKTNKRTNSEVVKKSWSKPDAGFALRFALSLVSVADWSPPRQCIDALQLLHCSLFTVQLLQCALMHWYTVADAVCTVHCSLCTVH